MGARLLQKLVVSLFGSKSRKRRTPLGTAHKAACSDMQRGTLSQETGTACSDPFKMPPVDYPRSTFDKLDKLIRKFIQQRKRLKVRLKLLQLPKSPWGLVFLGCTA